MSKPRTRKTPEPKPKQKRTDLPLWSAKEADAYWDYHSEHGEIVVTKFRKNFLIDGKIEKDYKWMTPSGQYSLKDVPRLLYNLPGVIAAREKRQAVFLVEGEKCADILISHKFVATTGMNGSKSWDENYTKQLAGLDIVLLRDADEAGGEWEEMLKNILHNTAKSIRALHLPGLKGKEDVYEWFQVYGHTRTELIALVKETLPEIRYRKARIPQDCFTNTDLANAHRFVANYGKTLRYTPEVASEFMEYDGSCWKPMDKGKERGLGQSIGKIIMATEVQDALDRHQQQKLETWAKRSQDTARISACIREVKNMISRPLENFDAEPHLFNCSNGVVDLLTNTLIPHSKTRLQYHTQISPVVYDKTATCPLWEEFLDSIADENTIKCLQMWCGYILSGYNDQELALYFLGEARRGKSTFADTIYNIMGDYAASMDSRSWVRGHTRQQSDDLIAIRGKRFCWIGEVGENEHLNEAQFKKVVSGEPTQGRHLYANPCTFKPTAKLLFAGNYPIETSTHESVFRRLHIYEFVNQPEEIKNYKITLRNEYSGILNWAIEGFLLYKEHGGLQESEAMKEAKERYWQSQDVVEEFLEDCCVRAPGEFVSSSNLWLRFRSYLDYKRRQQWTKQQLGRELTKKGFTASRTSRARGYEGLALTEDSRYAQKGFSRNAAGNAGTNRPDRKSGAPHPF